MARAREGRAGRDDGVARDGIIETITHLAFYAGWPGAMTAIMIAKEPALAVEWGSP